MIESNILGAAVGIQNQGVIDKSEGTALPSTVNGVIAGKFKRGRMDKPFKVTASNYKALLGHDPSNPSYLAVEDAFKRGISEVSILRTGGIGDAAIKCVANFAEMSLPSFDREVVPDYFVTVSRNGGEFKTYKLNPSMEGADFFAENFFSSDGNKVIFFDYPYGAEQLHDSNKGAICGIDSEGMILTPDQGAINLMDLELLVAHRKITPPYVLTKQHNWLTFKPTDGVSPANDVFFSMIGGDSGASTITVHSCAVIEKYIDPNVCMPTSAEILYMNGQNEPTGDLYGRYRVDGGEWVDYTAPANYYLVNEFLSHTGVMQPQGGGGISPFQFNVNTRGGYINGASAQEPYVDGQDGVLEIKRTTVDFELTDGGANDLVQLLFGGNMSVSSCAVGSWYGV
ncbi:hypothetical protein [Psychrobacter sp. FME13]|uniref:hypothetical protein n=1 Tax=Psychrobacter sp. FME13 TaxID=2487708 RepID=UPI001CE43DD6|nr:hypothetical protein [Psychrobacter sp. FME13]